MTSRLNVRIRPRTRRLAVFGLFLSLITGGLLATTAGPASASATTCITAPQGVMCTGVSGYGNYVQSISSFWEKSVATGPACTTRAWFFYIVPGGRVITAGYGGANGCNYIGYNRLALYTNSLVPYGTLVCSKFYTNNWADYVGQKCVGI